LPHLHFDAYFEYQYLILSLNNEQVATLKQLLPEQQLFDLRLSSLLKGDTEPPLSALQKMFVDNPSEEARNRIFAAIQDNLFKIIERNTDRVILPLGLIMPYLPPAAYATLVADPEVLRRVQGELIKWQLPEAIAQPLAEALLSLDEASLQAGIDRVIALDLQANSGLRAKSPPAWINKVVSEMPRYWQEKINNGLKLGLQTTQLSTPDFKQRLLDYGAIRRLHNEVTAEKMKQAMNELKQPCSVERKPPKPK